MPMNIKKSVHDYLSKIKTPRPSQLHLPSKKWMILGGCKHPRTPSFSLFRSALRGAAGASSGGVKKNNNSDNEATLADVDQFLVANFRSLFLGDHDDEDNNNTRRVLANNEENSHGGKSPKPAGGPASSFDSFEDQPPTGLTGSRGFFLTRGFSGSSTSTSTAAVRNDGDSPLSTPREKAASASFPDNCVAVLAYAKSPYEGFKRSMEGVVEERMRTNEKVDWDFMEELLSCYMSMNEKGTHKFILAAFVDVIGVMRSGPLLPAPAKVRSVRTVRIGGEIRKKNEVEGSLSS